MYQLYVIEIQRYADGSYGHLVHYVYDENKYKAQCKGESKYYEVLSAAAVSELPSHAAILFDSEGVPLMHKCYKHSSQQEESGQTTQEPEQGETDPTEEPDPGQE